MDIKDIQEYEKSLKVLFKAVGNWKRYSEIGREKIEKINKALKDAEKIDNLEQTVESVRLAILGLVKIMNEQEKRQDELNQIVYDAYSDHLEITNGMLISMNHLFEYQQEMSKFLKENVVQIQVSDTDEKSSGST